MPNLQVLEKLRARLLKLLAVAEVASAEYASYEDGRNDGVVDGIEMSIQFLDELVKELED